MGEAKFVPGLVSTIIPVHNRPVLLREAVESVLGQTYRPIEIIIVDDGSTDETVAVSDALVREYESEVRVFRQNNLGPGAARESGRRIAAGEFIQYLDSDDLLLPGKFEAQVSGLGASPDCQVSYGKTRSYNHGEAPENEPTKRTGERINTMFPSFLRSRWWSTSTPLFRRQVTDIAGPWEMLWNEEDWEYDCRVASQGVKLHYCDQFVSDTRRGRHDQLCSGGKTDRRKLSDRARAHLLIFQSARKHGITLEIPEMKHFARELFLLSRQCGVAGLGNESRMLFELARVASTPESKNGLDFRVYGLIARTIGWKATASLATRVDWFKRRR